MKRVPADNPATAARRAAMNLLARREHGFHELLDKLTERLPDIDRDILTESVSRLREEGLQSDARFVENFVRYRASRGVGPLKIKAELHPRRVDGTLLQTALYDGVIDWNELCTEVLRKRYGEEPPATPAERVRRQRFLLQRGFTQEQSRRVLGGRSLE